MLTSKIPIIIKKYNLHFISLFLIILSISLSNYFTNFKKKQNFEFQKLLENTFLNKTSVSVIENLNPRYEKIIIKVKSTNCEVIIRSMSAAGIWGKFVLPKKVVTGTKRSSVPISIEILLSTCIN